MEKKNEKQKKTKRKVKSVKVTSGEHIKTDVLGSYTGVPENPYEKPVQDADDL